MGRLTACRRETRIDGDITNGSCVAVSRRFQRGLQDKICFSAIVSSAKPFPLFPTCSNGVQLVAEATRSLFRESSELGEHATPAIALLYKNVRSPFARNEILTHELTLGASEGSYHRRLAINTYPHLG
jgi:hypothetical protein